MSPKPASRVTVRVAFDVDTPAQALLEACKLRSKMSSLNSIREHDGVVLDLEDTVREQLADSGEGEATQPPPAEPQVPHGGSEAAGEQASASYNVAVFYGLKRPRPPAP